MLGFGASPDFSEGFHKSTFSACTAIQTALQPSPGQWVSPQVLHMLRQIPVLKTACHERQMDSLPGNYPWRCPLLLSQQIPFLSNTDFINYSVHNLFPAHSNRMGAHCKCDLKIEKILPYCDNFIITFIDITQIPKAWQLPDTFRVRYTVSPHHIVPRASSLCGVSLQLQPDKERSFFRFWL